MRAGVVIPARDEEESIGSTLQRVPTTLRAHVVVVDDDSADRTAELAAASGAAVVSTIHHGYGWACRAGSRAALDAGCDVVVFLDADGSMPPEQIHLLLEPIVRGDADIVCGARSGPGMRAMPWHQRIGNRVIAGMLRSLHGIHLTELGPFRAVRATTLESLDLAGSRFAWPAQMLARAARSGARIVEVPVDYGRRTGGRSKVGGSVRGSILAVWDIASSLLGESRWRRHAPGP